MVFLFPGQGSQFAGMGKALANTWPAARRIFEEADDALGFSLSRLSFEGPEDQLKLTENTQPALLTVSMAAFAVLQEQGLRRWWRRKVCGSPTPSGWSASAAGICRKPCRPGWAPWRRC
jgi:malonyl CoA-acyl carrier protein transacylase